MSKKITELFAFVVLDEDGQGGEGVPAVQLFDTAMPMIGADMVRAEVLKQFVPQMTAQGKTVQLRKFSVMEVIETYPSRIN